MNCNDLPSAFLCYNYPVNPGIDQTTILVQGASNFTYTANIGSVDKVRISGFNFSTGGTITLSFDDNNGTPFTDTFTYAAIAPVVAGSITVDETFLDCGNDDGVLEVGVNLGATFTIVWSSSGSIVGEEIQNLAAGTYSVLISDDQCTGIYNVSGTITDGELTITNVTVNNLENCVSTINTASGYLPASFTADIAGGAGSSGNWDVLSIFPNNGTIGTNEDIEYTNISSAGDYVVRVEDIITGCRVTDTITVGTSDITFNLSTSEVPLVENNCDVLATGSVSVSTTSVPDETLSYNWTPSGGTGATSATYEDLDTSGTYTITVNTGNGTCEAQSTVDLNAEFCNFYDVNLDGIVNTGDLTLILGQWGLLAGCPEDINGDTIVNTADVNVYLLQAGQTFSQYCD